MLGSDGRYSPILEGIRASCEELGFDTVNLSHPYAVFRSSQIKGGSITINYRTLSIRLFVFLERWRGRGARSQLRLGREVKMYRALLEKYRPRAIVSIQPPSGLCQAARQLGINTIEAMHGTNISLSDKIYCTHMQQDEDVLPNVILSFDDVSHATFSTLCQGRNIAPLRASDPWLHLLRYQRAHEATLQDEPEKVQDRKIILVTLQWGYDGERESLSNIIPNGILHPELEEAFAATQGQDVCFYLRAHPIQMNGAGYQRHRKYIKSMTERYPHVEVERATKMPLPLLLDEVSGHITMSSSSVGEAVVAEVPSLLLCPTLHEGGENYGLFREIENSGLVKFGQLDSQYIVSWINKCAPRVMEVYRDQDIEKAHKSELSFYGALIDAPEQGCSIFPRQERHQEAI